MKKHLKKLLKANFDMSIKADYKKIKDELNFEEITAIIKDFERGFFIVRGRINKRDVLLKVISKKNKERIKSYRKEGIVDRLIEKHNRDLKNPLIINARVLATSENRSYFWIVRKYYSGGTLANYYPNKNFLYGYDIIRIKYLYKRRSILPQIVSNIESFQKMTSDFRKLGIKKEDLKMRYLSDYSDKDIGILMKEFQIDFRNSINFYKSNLTDYFSNKNIVASAGDLVPPNIIVKSDGNVVFSDFEWFCFDNYTMDVALLWTYLWKYKKWQKNLIDLTITNDVSRKFFRLSIIRIMFSTTRIAKKHKSESKNNYFIFLKKHIWTKYLIAAGESFEALMKVK